MSPQLRKRRCRCCKRWFARRAQNSKQKTCSRRHCQRIRHRKDCASWDRRNPERDRHAGIRGWAKAYPDYWRHYRATHPDYLERERQRMRRKRRSAHRVAKPDAWKQMAVEKLSTIVSKRSVGVAKPDAWDRRVEDIVDFLFWKEGVAKPDASPTPALVPDNTSHESGSLGHHPPAL